jgi:DNA (cytosine-5)-methyltransferase 1
MIHRPRTFGSLFAGVGGFDLGAEANGMACTWQVEIDPFCRAVLAKHWPGVDRSVTDVRAASAVSLARVDVIVGGFPCQDVSAAGKGAGLQGARSGLWYEYIRILEELRPPWAFVENVASGAKRWVCEVRSDLHAIGYRTAAVKLYAHDVGSPQRRGRIFIVAYAERFDVREQPGRVGGTGRAETAFFGRPVNSGGRHIKSGMGGTVDGISAGLVGHQFPAMRGQAQRDGEVQRTVEKATARGTGRRLNKAAELRAYGNAILPQCAELAIRWGLDHFGAA